MSVQHIVLADGLRCVRLDDYRELEAEVARLRVEADKGWDEWASMRDARDQLRDTLIKVLKEQGGTK